MHPRNRRTLFAHLTLALAAATLAGVLGLACGDDPTGPLAFQRAAYLRSEAEGAPWGVTTNEDAMNQAFGVAAWDDLRFETANTDSLFRNYTFLFLEGGDHGANEMEAFLAVNRTALENFVKRGGSVLINSAPNEGDGMSFAFGVDLVRHMCSTAEATDPTHPILAATDSTTFRGTAFSHAMVIGVDLTAILQHAGEPDTLVLAEKVVGRGRALFGGMTTDNFHQPQPAAHNLRINTLRYVAGVPLP